MENREAQVENALRALYLDTIEGASAATHPNGRVTPETPEAMQSLVAKGYADREEGRHKLTRRGIEAARRLVRRYRLAELLFQEVLGVRLKEIDAPACDFEHVIRPEIEEKICELLGHPTRCPHGNPIPPGACCEIALAEKEQTVAPLADLRPGQEGKVAFLRPGDDSKLKKLLAMGVLPGAEIALIRAFPSYVFRVGYTQYAVDRDLAHEIMVRIRRSP